MKKKNKGKFFKNINIGKFLIPTVIGTGLISLTVFSKHKIHDAIDDNYNLYLFVKDQKIFAKIRNKEECFEISMEELTKLNQNYTILNVYLKSTYDANDADIYIANNIINIFTDRIKIENDFRILRGNAPATKIINFITKLFENPYTFTFESDIYKNFNLDKEITGYIFEEYRADKDIRFIVLSETIDKNNVVTANFYGIDDAIFHSILGYYKDFSYTRPIIVSVYDRKLGENISKISANIIASSRGSMIIVLKDALNPKNDNILEIITR